MYSVPYTLRYTLMTSLSQRLLHTSLPHRIYTQLGVRSFSVSSSNSNQNPTPSDLAHQARLLIQDAPEAVVEPERKFQANQVCLSTHTLFSSLCSQLLSPSLHISIHLPCHIEETDIPDLPPTFILPLIAKPPINPKRPTTIIRPSQQNR